MVSLQSLLSDSLLLFIIRLLIRPEEIHIIIVLVILAGRGTTSTHIGRGVLAGLGELVHAGSEGLDVVVPSQGVGSLGFWSSGESLEHAGVGLAGNKPLDITVLSQKLIESFHTSVSFEVSEHLGSSHSSPM